LQKQPFLRCSGSHIIDESGNILYLRGVCFGNTVWANSNIPAVHHDERDFQRAAGMGMNVVRFYLNHIWFADHQKPGMYHAPVWDWLDTNIKWAAKYGIYLLFNMHIPPGGSQARGQGEVLWDEDGPRNRLRFLWKEIASRYCREPAVAGYGLVNQPVPNESVGQWQELAQNITDDIRMVDKNHIIFVERAVSVRDRNKEDGTCHYPVINDSNTAYEFHVTQPYNFTRQFLDYAGQGNGGRYPDKSRMHYINETAGHDNSGQPVFPRDTSYIKAALEHYTAYPASQSVPAYIGEFGTCVHSFRDNKGGLRWVSDVLDIAHEMKLHYTYHAYHDRDFGLYTDPVQLPGPGHANRPLIELFREKLLFS
jgi:endoglucanase